ncbi:MAG: hypothetical protein U1E76_04755 [Planctomycetota bacterium]
MIQASLQHTSEALVTCGTEIELAFLGAPAARLDPGLLAEELLRSLLESEPHVDYHGRDGAFFPQGLVYREMEQLIEVATYPAAHLEDLLLQEDASLALLARHARALNRAQPGLMLACLPDDLSGYPPGLVRPSELDAVSATVGTHLNFRAPVFREPQARRAMVQLVALLPAIVGPGGFVRVPRSRSRLQFRTDPRGAHVRSVKDASFHCGEGRPILKLTGDVARLQILALGYTPSRVDRLIKYGLLWLLALALARGDRFPDLELERPVDALRTAAPALAVRHRGRRCITPRRLLLRWLIDELLEPASRTAEGRALPGALAIDWSIRALDAIGRSPPEQVACVLPLEWAIRQHVCHAALGGRLWCPGERQGKSGRGQVEREQRAALLCVLAADIIDAAVRRTMVEQVTPRSWSYADAYPVLDEVAHSLAQRRPPRGALDPAPFLFEAMPSAGAELAANWHGLVRDHGEQCRTMSFAEARALIDVAGYRRVVEALQ